MIGKQTAERGGARQAVIMLDPLFEAVTSGSLQAVCKLLDAGTKLQPVDCIHHLQLTPLMLACIRGSPDIVDLLVSR